jgi:hypothetical protein
MSASRPRTVTRAAALALLALLLPLAPALACPVCYGDASSPLVSATRLGVFLLIGVTAAVLGAFVKFFVYLGRRARQCESETIASEWAHLQRSSAP